MIIKTWSLRNFRLLSSSKQTTYLLYSFRQKKYGEFSLIAKSLGHLILIFKKLPSGKSIISLLKNMIFPQQCKLSWLIVFTSSPFGKSSIPDIGVLPQLPQGTLLTQAISDLQTQVKETEMRECMACAFILIYFTNAYWVSTMHQEPGMLREL